MKHQHEHFVDSPIKHKDFLQGLSEQHEKEVIILQSPSQNLSLLLLLLPPPLLLLLFFLKLQKGDSGGGVENVVDTDLWGMCWPELDVVGRKGVKKNVIGLGIVGRLGERGEKLAWVGCTFHLVELSCHFLELIGGGQQGWKDEETLDDDKFG